MKGLIDTHHHLWDTTKTDYPWMTKELDAIRRRFDTDDLVAVTEPAGVSGTVLVQTISSFEESREFLAIADETDLILGVVAWVDLTSADVSDHIKQLKDMNDFQMDEVFQIVNMLHQQDKKSAEQHPRGQAWPTTNDESNSTEEDEKTASHY